MKLAEFNLGDAGNIFRSIREAITGEKIKDPDKMLVEINRLETAYILAKSRVLEAEAKSEHWLVAAWRPITMLVFVFIIANNYIIVPYANMFLVEKVVSLELTQNMWDLLKVGLGGYIAGRTVEKATKNWHGKKDK